METKSENQMALTPPLTPCLDLEALPERLTDGQLMQLVQMSKEPLPAPEPCDDKHFAQCIRLMSAVLPKQSKDEIAGKLFVAGYQRILQGYPKDAISYLAEQAMTRCRWFPTIAECVEILQDWKRSDSITRQRSRILQIIRRENEERREEAARASRNLEPMTADEIAALPEPVIALGLSCGALKRLPDGTIVHNEGE